MQVLAPVGINSVFNLWKQDLNVLLESTFRVNTASLGVTDEQLLPCVKLALGDAVQEIAQHYSLAGQSMQFRIRG